MSPSPNAPRSFDLLRSEEGGGRPIVFLAVAAVMSMIVGMLGISAANASGTIQITDSTSDPNNNHPHQACSVGIEFFGFDLGAHNVTVNFTGQNKSGAGVTVSSVPASGAGNPYVLTVIAPPVNGNTLSGFTVYALDPVAAGLKKTGGGYLVDVDVTSNTGEASQKIIKVTGCDGTMSIDKADAVDPVVPGANISYTLTATNDGLAAVSSFVITDTVSAPLVFVSASTASAGLTCNNANPVSCTYAGSLAPNASVSVTVVATVPANFAGVSVSNTAEVRPTVGGNPFDTDTETTAVTQPLTQSLTGQILQCVANAPTATNVGGTWSATGPTTVPATASGTSATVTQGAYSVSAVAPAGYTLGSCAGSPTGAQAVNVAGTPVTVTFYATQNVLTGSLTGRILQCVANAPTATNVGGTWSATGPTTVPATASGTSATVNQGAYSVSAVAPAGYTLGSCAGSPTGAQAVNVAGTPVTVTFYATANAVVIIPVTSPDLSIVKAGPTSPVKPGDNVPYTLTVTNIGNGSASNVQVSDTLPAAMTFVSASGTGFTCSGTSTISCQLAGALAPGASAVVNVVATLSGTYGSTAIANTATVLPTDANPANNTDTESTAVTLPTPPVDEDLGLSKTALQGSVAPGDVLSWTLNVTNVKGTPAAGFTVTDIVPAGLTVLSAGGTDYGCSVTGQTVTCTYTGAPLPVGSSAAFQIDAVVASDYAPTEVSNTAVVDPGGVDATNDSATAVTPVTEVITGGGGGGVTEPTPAEPAAGGGGPVLPFTGTNADQMLSWSVTVLMLGLLLAIAGRRRRSA